MLRQTHTPYWESRCSNDHRQYIEASRGTGHRRSDGMTRMLLIDIMVKVQLGVNRQATGRAQNCLHLVPERSTLIISNLRLTKVLHLYR